MKRPLCIAVLFFMFGIICGRYLFGTFNVAMFFALCALASAAICVTERTPFPLLFIAASAGGFICIARVTPTAALPSGEWTVIEATITKPLGAGYAAKAANGEHLVIFPKSDEDVSLAVGDIIIAGGVPRNTEDPARPGEFDERAYYAARGVFTKFYSYNTQKTGHADGAAARLNKLRCAVSDVYYNCLPIKEAGIINSVITGDRRGLSGEVRDLYSAGGIYHILAISGLHIGIIGLFLQNVLLRVTSKNNAAAAVIIALVLYTLFTGASPSTVRASIIVSIMLFGGIIHRVSDRLTCVALAALFILIASPYYLWDTGFRLSFAGVLGIIFFTSPIEYLIMRVGVAVPYAKRFFGNYWVKKSLSVSIAVNIAVMPVSTGYLPYIATYGVIVNIIVFPTFFLLVALGFSVGAFGLFFLPAAEFLSGGVYALLGAYERILLFFTSLPGSLIYTGYIPIPLVIAYYACFAACALYLNKKAGAAVPNINPPDSI